MATTRHQQRPAGAASFAALVTAPVDADVLTCSSPAELARAHGHRDQLLAAAVTLTRAAGHDPDVAACHHAGCTLDALGPLGGAICATAHRLARLPDAPPPTTTRTSSSAALDAFLAALDAAADAIRACRQTAHPGEGCWFSPAPGIDGCGEVLRLLHRCG